MEFGFGSRPFAGNVGYCQTSPIEQRRIKALLDGSKDSALDRGSRHLLTFALANDERDLDTRVYSRGDMLSINGTLTQGISSKVSSLLQSKAIRLVRINSAGGRLEEGRKIGTLIADKGLPVYVDGICASACANGILGSAPDVVVNGFIGFHGGSLACIQETPTLTLLKNLGIYHYWNMWSDSRAEQKFSGNVAGVYELSRLTLSGDRGFKDNLFADGYAPSIEELHYLGIKNVRGNIDLTLIEFLNTGRSGLGILDTRAGPHPMIMANIN